MEAITILNSIKSAGLTVSLLPGDRLKVYPADRITGEIRNVINKNKHVLVRHILSKDVYQARTWTEGNTLTCTCGHKTGWRLDGQPLCPACFYDREESKKEKRLTKETKETKEIPSLQL